MTNKTLSRYPEFILPKRADGGIDVDYLMLHYHDYLGSARPDAAKALAASGRMDAVQFLVSETDDTQLWDVGAYIGRYGVVAEGGLRHAPASASPILMDTMRRNPRTIWLTILGEIGTERRDVFEFLVDYLNDPHYTACTLRALYKTVFPEVVSVCLPFINDPQVGTIALQVLGRAMRQNKVLAQQAFEPLIQALAYPDAPSRSRVSSLLAEIGNPEAIPALETFVEHFSGQQALSRQDQDKLNGAREAITTLRGGPIITMYLSDSLWSYQRREDTDKKQTAMLNHAKIADGTWDIEYLLTHYREFHGDYRYEAAQALADSGREDAVRLLIANETDQNGWGDEISYGATARGALGRAPADVVAKLRHEQDELLRPATRPVGMQTGVWDIDYVMSHYREFYGTARLRAAEALAKSGREDAIRLLIAQVRAGDYPWGNLNTYGGTAMNALQSAPSHIVDKLLDEQKNTHA